MIDDFSFNAWKDGFCSGVKYCLENSKKLSKAEFQIKLANGQLDDLTFFHNVGSDAENGKWFIAGARQGTYMTMLTNWDHNQVNNNAALEELWKTVNSVEPDVVINRVAEDLRQELNLPVCMLAPEESKFFKYHLSKIKNYQV
jgi:hypothetical protein